MRLKKAGELDEEPTPKVEELFKEGESYLQKMASGSAGMRWGKAPTPMQEISDTKRRRAATSGEAANPYEGMFDFGGEGEELDPRRKKLLEKMEIRAEPKEKGAGYYAAKAGVYGWFFMIGAVIYKSSV